MYHKEMQATTNGVIEAIDRQREKRRMDDKKFSTQVLGISPSLWCRLKNGERALTLDRLKEFQQKLPEITPAVTIFIMRQGNDGENQTTVSEKVGRKPLRLLGTREGSKHPPIT